MKMILKGVLLYSTLLLFIFIFGFYFRVFELNGLLLLFFFIEGILIYVCTKVISIDDLEKLTNIKWLDDGK